MAVREDEPRRAPAIEAADPPRELMRRVWPESTVRRRANVAQVRAAIRGRGKDMAKNFITGRAQSVGNSVQRVADLRKSHPEWDVPPSAKSLARERLKGAKQPVPRSDDGEREEHEG
jgi:hypothetical protein